MGRLCGDQLHICRDFALGLKTYLTKSVPEAVVSQLEGAVDKIKHRLGMDLRLHHDRLMCDCDSQH